MTAALYALGAYLLGSIPFALIVSRVMGLADPRTYGSKNIGATNVLRSGNRIAALLTVIAPYPPASMYQSRMRSPVQKATSLCLRICATQSRK